MTELYSIPEVAKLFAVQESRLRYWMQTGFVGPTVRKNNRFYYTFRDLCAVKAATIIVKKSPAPESRVRRPRPRASPAKNSVPPANTTLSVGKGMPIFSKNPAVPSMP